MVQYSNLDRVVDARYHFKNGASLKSHMSKRNNSRIAMKTNEVLILFILTVFLFSSCSKNEMDNNFVIDDYRVQDVLYAKGSKLKQVSNKYGGEIWYLQSEYEYDNLGRISKISHPMYDNGKIVGVIDYEDYVYNTKNQLEEIKCYNNNLYAGFVILRTYKYSYDSDGNKIKEVISQTDSTLYYYDNNRLQREEKYMDGYFGSEPWRSELITYIEYEYDNQGNLVKETIYSGTDNTPLQYSVHSYQNGLNIKTEVFIYYNVIGKTNLREIRRYYDENDNLIYVESQELSGLSSSLGYISKYEYY